MVDTTVGACKSSLVTSTKYVYTQLTHLHTCRLISNTCRYSHMYTQSIYMYMYMYIHVGEHYFSLCVMMRKGVSLALEKKKECKSLYQLSFKSHLESKGY